MPSAIQQMLMASASGAVSSISPSSLTGLVGWWDSQASTFGFQSGVNINTISDMSGVSNTMNWWGFGRPTYAATGFNSTFPCFRVDAVNVGSALRATSFPMGTGNTLTFWYVGKNDAANSQTPGRALSYGGPGETEDFNNVHSWAFNINKVVNNNTMTITRNAGVVASTNATVTNATNKRLIGIINSSGVQTLYVNGVASTLSTAPGNWTTAGTLSIGRDAIVNDNYFAADIAEMGVATGDNTASVAGLDLYLKNRWGL